MTELQASKSTNDLTENIETMTRIFTQMHKNKPISET